MLTIKELNDEKIWEKFLATNEYATFLQSWRWIQFQESLGYKCFKVGIYNEDNNLVGVCFFKEEVSKLGKSLYSPRGPVIDWSNLPLVEEVLWTLKYNLMKKGYIFLRVDPPIKKDNEDVIKLFDHNRYKESIIPVQAENPWILEINGMDDKQLLAWMREHGRRKKFGNFLSTAKRSGVEIKFAETEKQIKQFTDMLEDLADRKNLLFQNADYFLKMKSFLKDNLLLPIAYINNKPVAGATVVAYRNEASYIYGASTPDTGQTHATHLLHWETILKAREIGIKRYNFWGVLTDEDYVPNNPGYGYSNFKRSFGGYVEPLIKPRDCVFNNLLYIPHKLLQKSRLRNLKKKGYL